MAEIILVILISLATAYAISEVFRYFGLPRVIGQILAGVVLGVPLIKSLLFTENVMPVFSFITNIGIILLFFFIGLEINIKKFRKNARESSIISIFNTIIPLVSGFLIGRYVFGFEKIASLIIGMSVSVSSQAISLDLLEETKLLKSKLGNLIISSGTVDDIFELFLISFLLIVFHSSVVGAIGFREFIVEILIFIIFIIMSRIFLIPFALRIFEREKSRSTLFMGALIIVLLIAYLSELLSVGSLIGALIAGILIRQILLTGEGRRPWEKNEISHSIHVVAFGFLIPIFFVSVGLNTDITTISSNLSLVIVLLLVDVLGTIAGTVIGVLLSRGKVMEGIIVGLGLLPKGDTELVIATLALSSGFISRDIFTAIITVALLSTLMAPIAFKILIKKFYSLNSISPPK